jgi:molybdate transport system substrate-binding protein
VSAVPSTIEVLSTHAVFEVLAKLGPQFEKTSGYKLSCRYDPSNAIRRYIDGGAAFDVAIITRMAINDVARQGKIIPETCVDIGRSGLGVSVRKGARTPYIGTVEDFKEALLAARSVVRSTEGASGQHFEKILDRLGITGQMRNKLKLGPSGRVAELVARGEAEMAVQQISELLPVRGAQFVGPFPPELQQYTVFAAGVSAASGNREAAEAFIATLTAPAATALFKANGLEPILRPA